MRTRFPSTTVFTVVVLLTLTLPLSGCFLAQTTPVKESKRLYYTYINTPVEVELDDPQTLDEAESSLVSRLIPVDIQLTALERSLTSLSGNVDQNMMESLLRRFPWLSGVVILDTNGAIIATAPPVPMKNLDFSPLMTPDSHSVPRDLRVSVQDTALGPEMIIARPFYSGQEMMAMLAVTFDFSGLMSRVTSAESLVVRSVDTPLWAGPLYSQGVLAAVNWGEELRHRSAGEVDGHPWLARYIGYLPLVFASSGQ